MRQGPLSVALLSVVLASLGSSAFAADPAKAAATATAPGGRRTINLDETPNSVVPAIHVAKGFTTTLMFEAPIRAVDLLDAGKIFAPPPANPAAKSLYLTPLKDPGATVTTLVVTVGSGAEVPFQIVGTRSQKEVDLVVDVVGKSGAGAGTPAGPAAANPAACCTSAAQLRQELDECQASSSTDALRKIAGLILTQDASASQSMVFEGRAIHVLDKQNGLLVEAQRVYRLFGYTYLVVSVENRLADRPWVLDKPQIHFTGAGADLAVVAFMTELPVLPPSESEKIVVLFATPPKAKSTIGLTLLEKSGTRHVNLTSIEL
jgi:hypothetical protein